MTLPGLVPQSVAPRPETVEAAALKVARTSLEALALKAGQVLDAKVLVTGANGLTQLAIAGQTLSVQLTAPLPPGTLLRLLVQPGGANGQPVLVTQPQATAPSAAPPSPLPQSPPALPLPQAAAPPATGTLPSPAPISGAAPAPQAPTHSGAPAPAAASVPAPGPIAASPLAPAPVAAPGAVQAQAPAATPSPVAHPVPLASPIVVAPPQGPVTAANAPPAPPAAQPAAAAAAPATATATITAPPVPNVALQVQTVPPTAQAAVVPPGAETPLPSGAPPAAVVPGSGPPPSGQVRASTAPAVPAAAMPAAPPAAVAQPGPPAAPPQSQPQLPPGATPPPQPAGFAAPSAGPVTTSAPAAMPPVLAAPTLPGPAPTMPQVPAARLPLAPTPAPLPPPQPGSAVETMLGQATQAAARQDSVAPLLANLAALSGRMAALPPPVAEAAMRLLGARISLDRGAPDGETLKQSVLRSGVFLDAMSKPGAPQPPQPGDTKAALLALRTALNAWLGPELAPVAPVARRPPPPTRGAQPHGVKGELPTLPEGASPKDSGRTLLGQAEAALSRLRLLQLSSLPQDAARAAAPGAAGAAEWNLELPMLLGHELALMGVQIQRDGGRGRGEKRERGWRMAFSLSFAALGEVGAQVALYGSSASVSIWAEAPETAAALEEMLPELTPALMAKGLSVGSVRVRRGRPAPAHPQAGQLLDSVR